ncbi:uncharacterized protein LOC109804464 isoform X2 [Cajanus cajan]|nr:uncharacterized protein LOC109804464 isoform X2 [Cajanus cajan]
MIQIRMGEQYQAEIPSLVSSSEYSWFPKNPHNASDTWSEIEKTSFLLGLYIFGKDLNEVKRFVGNKTMGDIQAFYYGTFYKSDKYQKWYAYKKTKRKGDKNAPKFFTRQRQQALLYRLLPIVTEECYNNLLKVSKTFAEEKMTLKDYVSNLKVLVGRNALVEAVGIGTEKDLTVHATYYGKYTHAQFPLCPETPLSKGYDRLSVAEIIHILKGNLRLSKARSHDLFWEAVWPRLLAKGWHSEHSGGNNDVVASKKHLLFFIPEVNEFSRTLVKGTHFFDSIPDILNKVASYPDLIELQTIQSVEPDSISVVVPTEAKRCKTSNISGCAERNFNTGHQMHQPDMVTLRRSTRTTQPTIRLLESFAFDHTEIKEK